MSNVGDDIQAVHGNWQFSGATVQSFDEHVRKSVPLYDEGHNLICDIGEFFIKSDSVAYEIGCSTGTLTFKLAEHNRSKPHARFIGIDVEEDMIAAAEEKRMATPDLNASFIAADALTVELEPADLVVCYYVVQFVNPAVRQLLIDRIYKTLNWGGAFLMFEKVRGADARFQDILTTLYMEYKLRMGYTPDDIVSKTRSLKGVLEPFSTQGNIDCLNRAGFTDINTIQKYICFEGLIAIK